MENKKLRTICTRTGLICFETLAVVLVVIGIVAGIGIWRLTSGPVDIGFAKDYIEQTLQDQKRGLHARIEDAALYWPDLAGPLLLEFSEVTVYNQEDRALIALDKAAVSLSKTDLLIGNISPTALIFRNPKLKIIRREDNSLELDFGAATVETPATNMGIKEILSGFLKKPDDLDEESGPLASLKMLHINNAKLMIEDHRLGFSWYVPHFDIAFETQDNNIKADMTLVPKEDPQSYISADLTYDRQTDAILAEMRIEDINLQDIAAKVPELSALKNHTVPLSGTVQGRFDADLNPKEISVSLTSPAGRIEPPEIKTPLTYSDVKLNATYNAQGQTLSISNSALRLNDIPLTLEGRLDIERQNETYALSGPLTARIPELDHAQIEPLWPENLKEDASYEWISEKIRQGTYTDARATAIITAKRAGEEWNYALENLKAGFDFKNAEVDYSAPLTPIKAASGAAIFDLSTDTLTVAAQGGQIDQVRIKHADIVFTEVIAEGRGDVSINMDTEGPLPAYLRYVSSEPINAGDTLTFDFEKTEGTATLNVQMDMPTRDDILFEEIKLDVSGQIRDILIPDLFEGLPLSGGPLSIKVKNNKAKIHGNALLADRQVTLRREGFLRSEGQPYKSKTFASLSVDPNLRQHLDMGLDDYLKGSPVINMTYTEFGGGKAEAELDIDLTPAVFLFNPFDYKKPAGTEGQAELTALLENDRLVEIQDLTVKSHNFLLEPSRLMFKQEGGESILTRLQAPRFVIGETVASADIEREPTGRFKTLIKGPFLDARPFLKSEEEEEYDNPPLLISVAVDQMRTSEGETVQYAKIYADINRRGAFNQFEVDAIAGDGDIYLRFKPDKEGKRVFHFEADDAGAALKAFGLYDKIVGGKMTIYGQPIRGIYDRNLLGSAVIENFKVVDAPSLARLLSAMSLPGLMQTLRRDGISFAKLEANFDWLYREGGSVLVLKDGRTSGNELGLTFEGTYDQDKDFVNLSGQIIPLSSVNRVIGNIPVLGDLITGGTGSLIAATYTIKGEADDPKISVNPLSVLAPGILRRILFE